MKKLRLDPNRGTICLLGFTVADEVLVEISRRGDVIPAQTHAFAWNVVRALRSSGGAVRLLSAWPVTSYPNYPQVIFRMRKVRGDIIGYELPFINLPGLKHCTRLLSALLLGGALLGRWRTQTVLIHGVHSPFLVFGALLDLAGFSRVIVLITDPPGVVRHEDGALTRVLKSWDRVLVSQLLSMVSGVISLTPHLASRLAPSKPALVLDGFAEQFPIKGEAGDPRTRPRIVYAGGLFEEYGVRTLVEAVLRLNLDCELAVFGKGPLSEWIAGISESDSRVLRPKALTRDEVLGEYAKADVLVQPRPIDQELIRVSFPSKLLEYISAGVPVVSTRIPGISVEMEDMVYWVHGDGVGDMANALERCFSDSLSVRVARAQSAREHVMRTRGPDRRGQQIMSFVRTVHLERSPVGKKYRGKD